MRSIFQHGINASARKRWNKSNRFNAAPTLEIYIDGADEANHSKQLIKGGGGALTREKIVAQAADEFVCMIAETKLVNNLGGFPLPVEVIPLARGLVARQLKQFSSTPIWRQGFVTDNGNIILDIHGLKIADGEELERKINDIPGVVSNGYSRLERPIPC